MRLEKFWKWNWFRLGRKHEISAATEEDTEQHIGSTSSINSDGEIELVVVHAAEIELGLAIREGRSRCSRIWSTDYVFGEGLSVEDDVTMTFFYKFRSCKVWGSSQKLKVEDCQGWGD